MVTTAGVDLGCIRKSPCSAFPIFDKFASCKKGFNVFLVSYLYPHLPFHTTASWSHIKAQVTDRVLRESLSVYAPCPSPFRRRPPATSPTVTMASVTDCREDRR